MSEIDYNNKAAYNAITHENRFQIEEEIEEELEDNLDPRVGIFLTKNNESMPVFAPVGGCERIFSRKEESGLNSGARIVLTRDNYGHRATGLGGIGASKCEAIDIVAGSLSSSKAIRTGKTQSRANFAEDGARIYLTERGDINAYFATAKSETAGVSASSKLKSGIGIKADHTLLIGRERVRILAGTSKYDGGERLVTGNQPTRSVIEIGSTTSEKHHKAVLGDNLVKYLQKVNKSLSDLNEKIISLEIDLVNHKFAMAVHQHQGVGLGAIVTFPDPISAIPNFLQSIPTLTNNISSAIQEEYNQIINERRAFGLPSIGIEGSKEDKILSSTVYIGE
jgi:hypothetical protein